MWLAKNLFESHRSAFEEKKQTKQTKCKFRWSSYKKDEPPGVFIIHANMLQI